MKLFSSLPKELYIFIISMLPIIELRGSIPAGAAMDVPFYLNYLLSVLGNLLPVPFILLFIPRILDFLGRFRLFRPLVNWLRRKAEKNKGRIIKEAEPTEKVMADGVELTESASADISNMPSGELGERRKMTSGIFLALVIFVALPLPGTGAWTGQEDEREKFQHDEKIFKKMDKIQ